MLNWFNVSLFLGIVICIILCILILRKVDSKQGYTKSGNLKGMDWNSCPQAITTGYVSQDLLQKCYQSDGCAKPIDPKNPNCNPCTNNFPSAVEALYGQGPYKGSSVQVCVPFPYMDKNKDPLIPGPTVEQCSTICNQACGSPNTPRSADCVSDCNQMCLDNAQMGTDDSSGITNPGSCNSKELLAIQVLNSYAINSTNLADQVINAIINNNWDPTGLDLNNLPNPLVIGNVSLQLGSPKFCWLMCPMNGGPLYPTYYVCSQNNGPNMPPAFCPGPQGCW